MAIEVLGSPAASGIDALYRSSAREVYAFVRTIVRDDATAEDVTALAFERAFRRHSSFDPGRGSQRAWLFGIARNAAVDELRRRKRMAPLLVDVPDEQVPAEADHSDDAVRRAAVASALADLPVEDRELVALKFHGGLSNAELADVLKMSESNVGTRLHRVVTKLREACHVAS